MFKKGPTKSARKKVITFAALKGGVGKTTLSLNVAIHVATLGFKVLVVDLDPEACATNTLLPENSDLTHTLTFYDILKRNEKNITPAILSSRQPNLDLVPSALINHHAEKFLHNCN